MPPQAVRIPKIPSHRSRWEGKFIPFYSCCRALLHGLDEAVVPVLAGVDHAGVPRCHILEHEELMSEQIHLQNCFFNRHRLDGEALASDIELSLFFKILACLEYAALKSSASESALESGLVFADLTLDVGNGGVQRIAEAFGTHLRAEEGTRRTDRDLNIFLIIGRSSCSIQELTSNPRSLIVKSNNVIPIKAVHTT
mgnify:CR=1 FL=1